MRNFNIQVQGKTVHVDVPTLVGRGNLGLFSIQERVVNALSALQQLQRKANAGMYDLCGICYWYHSIVLYRNCELHGLMYEYIKTHKYTAKQLIHWGAQSYEVKHSTVIPLGEREYVTVYRGNKWTNPKRHALLQWLIECFKAILKRVNKELRHG